jgi:hypothetical protein
VHVAVPELSVVVEEVHSVRPPVPLTDQVTVPVGVIPPVGPATDAVNVTLLPTIGEMALVTTFVGLAFATTRLLEAAVIPLMAPVGVAVIV